MATDKWNRRSAKLAAANQRCREAGQARHTALIEDVEFLLDSGEWPGRIVHRVGRPNQAALAAALRRAGRPDLAYRCDPYVKVALTS